MLTYYVYTRYNRKGFTLIELLVVVLIISILAAIVVPRYRISVLKSKIANLEILASAFMSSQARYRLSTGSFATYPYKNKLDTEFPVFNLNDATERPASRICIQHATGYNYKVVTFQYADSIVSGNSFSACHDARVSISAALYNDGRICWQGCRVPEDRKMALKVCDTSKYYYINGSGTAEAIQSRLKYHCPFK